MFNFRLSFIICAAMAVPAHAGIILDAMASVDQSGYSRQVGYNAFEVYDSGQGYRLHDNFGPCGGGGGCLSYSLTSSGLTDTVGTATSGFESSHATVSLQYGGPIYNAPYYYANPSGDAYAAASLNSGSVGVSASGTFLDSFPSPNSGQNGGGGSVFAQFNDGLHFSVFGANAGTITLIGVSYTLNGLISGASGPGNVDSILQFGSASLRDSYDYQGLVPRVTGTTASGWQSYTITSNTPGLLVFNGVYALLGAQTDVGVAATLDAGCGIGANCDYSHTAQFRFTNLGSNVSYTSDSGVFLTAQPSAVPEPGTVALLGAGLAGLVFWRKRDCCR